jgi:SRSO17 transposase
VLDQHASALLRRLTRWLDQFKDCFGHRAQHVSLRQYVDGLLGDSTRKSMSAMLERISEPTSYQAFQHFVTHAPWNAEGLWRRLRAVTPERTGILILDETSFPKSGPHSVGVARQYCGALGKVANCQVAVTAALWTGQRAWPMGAALYLPQAWTTDPARRATARIPLAVRFQEKWRLALTLLRQTRAAGMTLTAVVADAEYGDNSTVRQTLHRLQLAYALGISPTLTMFRGTPRLRIDRQQPPPRNRRDGWPDQVPVSVRALSDAVPARAWRRVAWRNGTNPIWEADFVALRVTPTTDWRRRQLAPEVWLLCERGLGPTGRRRHYLVSLPASASLTQLVRLAHQRWAIEQHYQDLKTELGLDHFEGRTYPGWQHHMVISAVAYAFVQRERMRPRAGPPLTFPQARAFVQEIFTGLLFISRPRYLQWMKQAEQRFRQLRMCRVEQWRGSGFE